MTLKEYIDELNKLVERHPEALDRLVVYSTDAEGNCFYTVNYKPSLGMYSDSELEFREEQDVSAYHNIPAICIN